MILSESTKRNLCLLPGVLALAYVLGMQACRSPRDPGSPVEGVERAQRSASSAEAVATGRLPPAGDGGR